MTCGTALYQRSAAKLREEDLERRDRVLIYELADALRAVAIDGALPEVAAG